MIVVTAVTMKLDSTQSLPIDSIDDRARSAAYHILIERRGVVGVDDISDEWGARFVVTMDDESRGPIYSMSTLANNLTQPGEFRLCYAQDGAWKTALLAMIFEVAA